MGKERKIFQIWLRLFKFLINDPEVEKEREFHPFLSAQECSAKEWCAVNDDKNHCLKTQYVLVLERETLVFTFSREIFMNCDSKCRVREREEGTKGEIIARAKSLIHTQQASCPCHKHLHSITVSSSLSPSPFLCSLGTITCFLLIELCLRSRPKKKNKIIQKNYASL